MLVTKCIKYRADNGFREFVTLNKILALWTLTKFESPTFHTQTVSNHFKKPATIKTTGNKKFVYL